MTRRKQGQRSLWEGILNEDVRSLWEPWMVEADKLLEDDELIDLVFEAQGERHQHSATNGRGQTPADIAMRLLLLKHVRNWSFAVLEREVKLNLAYRGRQLQWPGASWFYRLRVCGRAGCWLIWLR